MGKIVVDANKKTVSLIQKTDSGEQLVCPITTIDDVYTNLESGEKLSDVLKLNSRKSLKLNNVFSTHLQGKTGRGYSRPSGNDYIVVFRNGKVHNVESDEFLYRSVDGYHHFVVLTYYTLGPADSITRYTLTKDTDGSRTGIVSNDDSFHVYDLKVSASGYFFDVQALPNIPVTHDGTGNNFGVRFIEYAPSMRIGSHTYPGYMISHTIDLKNSALFRSVSFTEGDGGGSSEYNTITEFAKLQEQSMVFEGYPKTTRNLSLITLHPRSKAYTNNGSSVNGGYDSMVNLGNSAYRLNTRRTNYGTTYVPGKFSSIVNPVLADNGLTFDLIVKQITPNGNVLHEYVNGKYKINNVLKNNTSTTVLDNIEKLSMVVGETVVLNPRLVSDGDTDYITWFDTYRSIENVASVGQSHIAPINNVSIVNGEVIDNTTTKKVDKAGDFMYCYMNSEYGIFVKYKTDGTMVVYDTKEKFFSNEKSMVVEPGIFYGFEKNLIKTFDEKTSPNMLFGNFAELDTFILTKTNIDGSLDRRIVSVFSSEQVFHLMETAITRPDRSFKNTKLIPFTISGSQFSTTKKTEPDVFGNSLELHRADLCIPSISKDTEVSIEFFDTNILQTSYYGIMQKSLETGYGIRLYSRTKPEDNNLFSGVIHIEYTDPITGVVISEVYKSENEIKSENLFLKREPSQEMYGDKTLSIGTPYTGIDYDIREKDLNVYVDNTNVMDVKENGVIINKPLKTNRISSINSNMGLNTDNNNKVVIKMKNGESKSIQDMYNDVLNMKKSMVDALRALNPKENVDITVEELTSKFDSIVGSVAGSSRAITEFNSYSTTLDKLYPDREFIECGTNDGVSINMDGGSNAKSVRGEFKINLSEIRRHKRIANSTHSGSKQHIFTYPKYCVLDSNTILWIFPHESNKKSFFVYKMDLLDTMVNGIDISHIVEYTSDNRPDFFNIFTESKSGEIEVYRYDNSVGRIYFKYSNSVYGNTNSYYSAIISCDLEFNNVKYLKKSLTGNSFARGGYNFRVSPFTKYLYVKDALPSSMYKKMDSNIYIYDKNTLENIPSKNIDIESIVNTMKTELSLSSYDFNIGSDNLLSGMDDNLVVFVKFHNTNNSNDIISYFLFINMDTKEYYYHKTPKTYYVEISKMISCEIHLCGTEHMFLMYYYYKNNDYSKSYKAMEVLKFSKDYLLVYYDYKRFPALSRDIEIDNNYSLVDHSHYTNKHTLPYIVNYYGIIFTPYTILVKNKPYIGIMKNLDYRTTSNNLPSPYTNGRGYMNMSNKYVGYVAIIPYDFYRAMTISNDYSYLIIRYSTLHDIHATLDTPIEKQYKFLKSPGFII